MLHLILLAAASSNKRCHPLRGTGTLKEKVNPYSCSQRKVLAHLRSLWSDLRACENELADAIANPIIYTPSPAGERAAALGKWIPPDPQGDRLRAINHKIEALREEVSAWTDALH